MRVIICILGIAITTQAFGQRILDTVYFNKNWEAIEHSDSAVYYRYISVDTTGDFLLHVEDYYASGRLQMKGDYKSIEPDRKTGNFTYYHENGEIQIECIYNDNQYDGEYKEWYENGQLKTQTFYKNGYIDGKLEQWSVKGLINKIAQYKNGLKEGKFMSFYDNGQMLRKEFYKQDKFIKGKCFTREGRDTTFFNYFVMPKFKEAGMNKFSEFIKSELHYPDEAKEEMIEGRVLAQITISSDGQISDVKLLRKDKEYFNKEAIRVLKSSPKWTPGKKDGKNVKVKLIIPIIFSLE